MSLISNKDNILFIDDEFFCHDIVKLTLTNYKILSAYNGQEGINLAHKYRHHIMLILLDISLPDINGYEVYKNIKKDKDLANIPIIFQSGYFLSKDEIRNIINCDAEIEIIYKPYTGRDLLKKIEKFVFAI